MKTKREWSNEIAAALGSLWNDLKSGKLSPAQHMDAERALFTKMQKQSGYAGGAYAQVWQMACRQYQLKAFGWCCKSEF